MEAFKGKVVRLRVWGLFLLHPALAYLWQLMPFIRGKKGGKIRIPMTSWGVSPFTSLNGWPKMERESDLHTHCVGVCVFFQWFSTNAKSNFKWRKNITTCVYGCSSSQLHIFTRLFGQEKSGLPPTKKFGFRGQETVKTPPQIERGRRRPGKTAAKNTPDLGGAKVGLNDLFWPLVPASSRGTSSLIHW